MKHLYDAIALEAEVLAGLAWQPIDAYETRPMERRGRPLPVILRKDDCWVFGCWSRGYGWVCQEGERGGELIAGFEPTHWAAPPDELAFRLAGG